MKTRTTPLSPTKTQALSRVLHFVPLGYTRACMGTVPPDRLPRLLSKFDATYGIAHSRAQRIVNKRAGRANTLLAVYSPPVEYLAQDERLPWVLLTTNGAGVEAEAWQDVMDRPTWLGYELVRHNHSGEIRWTWRRTKDEMAQLYAELTEDLNRKRYGEIGKTLERIAHQPGFHGVRQQSHELCKFAVQRGYRNPVPHLYFVQKASHGIPYAIQQPQIEPQ